MFFEFERSILGKSLYWWRWQFRIWILHDLYLLLIKLFIVLLIIFIYLFSFMFWKPQIWRWSGKRNWYRNGKYQLLDEKKFMARTKQRAQKSSGRKSPREHNFTPAIFHFQFFRIFRNPNFGFFVTLCEIWAAGATPATSSRQVRRNLFNVIVLGFFEYI